MLKTIFLDSKFKKFIFVGIINTLFGYGVYLFMIRFGLNISLALIFSTFFGILFNFKTTGRFVFKSDDNSLIIKFIGVYIFLFLFNLLGISLLNMIGFSLELSGALILFPAAVLSFILNKFLVFKL